MTTQLLVYSAVIFVGVTALAMFLLVQLSPNPARKRLETALSDTPYAEPKEEVSWVESIRKIAAPFAKLSLPKEGWENSSLRRRFMHAGYRSDAPIAIYFASKTLLAIVLPALFYIGHAISGLKINGNLVLVLILLMAAIGYYLPNFLLERKISLRKREIFENFPDAADLMLVCVESGLGLDSALAKVADEIRLKSVTLAQELHLVNLELRAGASREKALRNLAIRTGVPEVETFVTMITQADRFGTSIGESLRVFSDELRTKRQLRAEELAAKIPLKLLFPLVFFIFPSMLLVLLGPAFIQIYRILLPTLSGN
jgi:tight adherence protein C